MLGKNKTLVRDYYWTDTATKISFLRIELIDQKTTTLKVGQQSDSESLPHSDANRVIVTRNSHNNDLILDYFSGDARIAQEIISGHSILRLSVEFPSTSIDFIHE